MTRLDQARAEIARRRVLAEESLTVLGPDWEQIDEPWPTRALTDPSRLASRLLTSARRAQFILANDPARVLAVLTAASAVLDRHLQHGESHPRHAGRCCQCVLVTPNGRPVMQPWPCPDAAAVLDLYAPEQQP